MCQGSINKVANLMRLEQQVVVCRLCPRLVEHREYIKGVKTRRFANQDYWGKPVPAFGDPRARLLVVGLAPAAHGGNRTGRMFTGDRSGDWLCEALHRFGFANRPDSVDRNDGLQLLDTFITAAARCVPPMNRPTTRELENCRYWLVRELELLERVRVIVTLGRIAFDGLLAAWRVTGRPVPSPKPKFSHGSVTSLGGLEDEVLLLGSYHPSQQNTFTGRLRQPMFHQVFRNARRLLDSL
jgi:uracil-DNA glycosylase family 4